MVTLRVEFHCLVFWITLEATITANGGVQLWIGEEPERTGRQTDADHFVYHFLMDHLK